MINLNYRDSKPIYEQIHDGFRKLIVTGVMAADEKLPSVRALASDLAINPNTIQRAYTALEAEGYIYSVAGKGSFVSGDHNSIAARKTELLLQAKVLAQELRSLGVTQDELLTIFEEGECHD